MSLILSASMANLPLRRESQEVLTTGSNRLRHRRNMRAKIREFDPGSQVSDLRSQILGFRFQPDQVPYGHIQC